jgi:hypothetical protein
MKLLKSIFKKTGGIPLVKKCCQSIVLLMLSNHVFAINHVTKIEVFGKQPSQIYDFMFSLDKPKYMAWHPEEHAGFMIIKQTEAIRGSVFYFDERIGGFRVNHQWEVVGVMKNHKIIMKAIYKIPVYLILTFDETPNGTLVTHDLQIGNQQKYGGIKDWFIKKFIFTLSRQNALTKHAIEEFKNLEKLI